MLFGRVRQVATAGGGAKLLSTIAGLFLYCMLLLHVLRYDTIRYDIFTCAHKLTTWPA